MSSSPNKNHIYSIQAFRGLAALTVVAAHSAAHLVDVRPEWTWFAGRVGVTLFFIVSGFIMVEITPTNKQLNPLDFMKRRLLRIVPFYWAMTLFTAALALALPMVFKKTIFDLNHLIGSMFFIPMYRPADPTDIAPFMKLGWTLNYEMFFYIIFACLFMFQWFHRVIVMTLFFVALVVLGRLVDFDNAIAKFYTGYDLIGFIFGAWLSVLSKKGILEKISTSSGSIMIIAGLILYLVLVLTFPLGGADMPLQILMVFASFIIIGGGIALEKHGRFSTPKILDKCGDASYSIYLMHMFPVGAIAVVGNRLFGGNLNYPEWIVLSLIAFIAGTIFGWVCYLLIEKPITKLFRERFL